MDCHGEMKISRLLQGAPANFLPARCGNRYMGDEFILTTMVVYG